MISTILKVLVQRNGKLCKEINSRCISDMIYPVRLFGNLVRLGDGYSFNGWKVAAKLCLVILISKIYLSVHV